LKTEGLCAPVFSGDDADVAPARLAIVRKPVPLMKSRLVIVMEILLC
jgi:hypothetical protein